ncbi:MAG: transposase [Deltaproteobacteria bacterium]|nr:transposase [Deltaproteobacteria bacterium]
MVDGISNRQRRSIRLPHYDYGDAGAYFITLSVNNRACIFGDVVDGAMVLNDTGRIVVSEWIRTPTIRSQVALDEYVVMPNHFHALEAIESSRRGVLHTPSEKFHSPSQTLGAVVRGFKSATTKWINEMRGTPRAAVWQRNYYDHVLRNDEELQRVREYIVNNPAQWALDRENPEKGVCHTPLVYSY